MVSVSDYEVKSLPGNKPDNTGEGGKKCRHKNDKDEKEHKQRKSYTQDANTNGDNEDLYQLFIDTSKKLGQQMKRTLYIISSELGGKQLIDRTAQWCVQHPQLAICLLAAALVASLPLLTFVAFALSSLVLTFTGFLVLEGTLLTIISMVAFGLLFALGIILLSCTFVGLATYFGVSRLYGMYDNTANRRTNLGYSFQFPETYDEISRENVNHNRLD